MYINACTVLQNWFCPCTCVIGVSCLGAGQIWVKSCKKNIRVLLLYSSCTVVNSSNLIPIKIIQHSKSIFGIEFPDILWNYAITKLFNFKCCNRVANFIKENVHDKKSMIFLTEGEGYVVVPPMEYMRLCLCLRYFW